MKNSARGVLLACILTFTLPVVGLWLLAAKGLFNPLGAVAHDYQGIVKVQKGDLDEAMADYDQAVRLNSKLAGAYVNRANAKLRKGNLDGAMADYDQANNLKLQFGLAYRNRGNARR